MRNSCGFSLIELMITVAIVGILASIAMPSYVSHLARGKRAEAKQALLENALFLETHYTTRGFYSTVKDNKTAPTLPVTQVPRSGSANYTLSASVTNIGYILTATAVNSMAADACGNFTLDQTGTQGVSGSLGVADCWNR
jgi:type IV pilus assembly protein PilE